MDGRGVAWLGYLPIPGLALAALAAAPTARLVRYHAWQATMLVALLYLWLIAIGMLSLLSTAPAFRTSLGLISGIGLVAALVQLALGGVAAARGLYPRLRPAWDLAALLRRPA